MTNTAAHTSKFLHSVLRWLRAGYPEGVPGPDRVPLLALLRSTPLTEEQIAEVVRNITDHEGSPETIDHPIDRDEIAHFISDMTHYDAGPENVIRVAATLASVGWPLAGIDVSEVIPGDEWGEAAELAARGPAPEEASL
ncbi:hypothetical protein A5714_09600 [Mycobacterium sp. E2462]|uniref:DUF3349 domain-containing protein n=1 Tax=unclassified Mycobacterium TaxID=2642494 RepID=UPI000800C500|nr:MULTISPECIES: DUF3349 domain-containing protein [unclassified Mycobacterium]OBG78464.1 hypothetical protein A5700_16540 [Mycobacterium sp. E1214]OBH27830.1 hypothetical protein A5693_02430 [Mycobacterium sp. E1319]OBI18868.1 hypothetical protein A5714_09600 [Mycobacterium sp. E2462]